jgi:hypothetical protein
MLLPVGKLAEAGEVVLGDVQHVQMVPAENAADKDVMKTLNDAGAQLLEGVSAEVLVRLLSAEQAAPEAFLLVRVQALGLLQVCQRLLVLALALLVIGYVLVVLDRDVEAGEQDSAQALDEGQDVLLLADELALVLHGVLSYEVFACGAVVLPARLRVGGDVDPLQEVAHAL